MPRDRTRELRSVRAGDLIHDPRNWRKHPAIQRDGLQTMLDRVGWADAVIARETPEGLMLVDGHLRAGLDEDELIPVLVVDLDDDEAGEVLATLDPLASMAEPNTEALGDLLSQLEGMEELLAEVRDAYGMDDEALGEQDDPPVVSGLDKAVAAVTVRFYDWENVADFEHRLGLDAGTVEREKGRQFTWPKG